MAEILCPVAHAARVAPDAIALRMPAAVSTYGEWNARIAALAATLKHRGVAPGHRVAIVARTSADYLTLLLALWRLKAVACPLNVRWPRERLAATVCGTVDGIATGIRIQHFVTDQDLMPALPYPSWPLAELCCETDGAGDVSDAIDTEHHATIYFTSGSSGVPKAVLHRLNNHRLNALASNANIPLREGECWLLSLPLYHVAGMGVLWRCIAARAVIAVPAEGDDVDAALERFGAGGEGGVTHLSLVTTQLYRLLQSDHAIDRLRSLRAILLGGSAVPTNLIDRAVALALPLFKTYGLTEMASQVATTRVGDPPEALYTSGTPLIEGSVRIDPRGHILVRGCTRFEGYLRADVLECPFDARGWFDTGDRGEWTEEGYLRVIGRADTMYISGGENVQPEEVERALTQLEGIDEALVVPVSDPEYGQRGFAFVRGTRDRDSIAAALRALLPGYMIPRTFMSWPEHLVEGHTKVNRAAFRAHAESLRSEAAATPTGPPPE